jgi:aminoglycoside phosphotransferase (APT) family kinase protein
MAHASADLPVPEVLAVGDAPWGGAFAISRRHHGRFLEDVGSEVAPALGRLLDALRAVPEADGPSWRQSLLDRLVVDQPPGWRAKLRVHAEADAVFETACTRLRELIPALPERRDLIHGDLLHKNVLVTDDASRVSAVFSWKCAERGDHLYDTAWCTFWGETFHPGIAVLDAFALMAGDEPDAALRHHAYEIHIGASHLGWYAWTEDIASLQRLTQHVAALLERGPRG